MVTIFFLLALVLVPAFAIVFAQKLKRLESRVTAMDSLLQELRSQPGPMPEESEPEKTGDAAAKAAEEDADTPGKAPEEAAAAATSPDDKLVSRTPQPEKRFFGLEEQVGSKWSVWAGGLALALGGIFLVRYTIEQGLIGPGARIALGALFAASLLAAGEYLRRIETRATIAGLGTAYIPGVLTAAGIITGFATVYVAFAIYGFLGPLFAFVFLGAWSLAGLALSAVHGPGLAGLGLLGSYFTPALVGSSTPNAWALFAYLAFVTAAALVTARTRGWLWLAASAAAGATIWGFIWFNGPWTPADNIVLAAYIAALMLLSLYVLKASDQETASRQNDETEAGAPPAPWTGLDLPSSGILAGMSLLTLGLVRFDAYSFLSLLLLASVCATFLASAWRWPGLSALVPWSATLFIAAYASWHVPLLSELVNGFPQRQSGLILVAPPGLQRFLVVGIGFSALFAISGYMAALRREGHAFWTAVSALTPVLTLAYAYLQATHFEHSVPFGVAALALAAVLTAATAYIDKTRRGPQWDWCAGVYAAATVASLALALTILLEKGWLTISLALVPAGLAWISTRRSIHSLRYIAAALVAIVMLRLLYDPLIVGGALGNTPIFNWLLYGYGVPALACVLAAILFRQQRDDLIVQFFEAAAVLFVVLLVTLELRHWMYDGKVLNTRVDLAGISIQTAAWLGLSLGLQRLFERTARSVLTWAATGLGILGFAAILVGHLVTQNPLFVNTGVGPNTFFNNLLIAYALPALLCAAIFWLARGKRHPAYVLAAGASAYLVFFAYISLQVRVLFQGEFIGLFRYTSDGEWYTYSAVWLVYGAVLLVIGLFTGAALVRYASLGVIVLTLLKAFLFDMSSLEGVLRALSFIGLGLALVGVGYLYQKVIFPGAADSGPDSSQ